MQPPESNQLAAVNSRQTLQGTDMDIKELALKVADQVQFSTSKPFTCDQIEDFATRLIAAYLKEQKPVSLYPCGFKELNSLVIKNGAYLARGMNEDEPVTESIRSSAMVLVGYAKDMSDLLAKQPLFTAPPEPAPQQQKPQTTIGDSADPAQPAAACAAPSSEEVREMVEMLRSMDTYGYESQLAYAAADLLERLAAERDLWRETDLRDAARGDELAAEVKRLAALVPDGCVVVPREPTAAMILEGMCQALTVETYRAMIAAGEVK